MTLEKVVPFNLAEDFTIEITGEDLGTESGSALATNSTARKELFITTSFKFIDDEYTTLERVFSHSEVKTNNLVDLVNIIMEEFVQSLMP